MDNRMDFFVLYLLQYVGIGIVLRASLLTVPRKVGIRVCYQLYVNKYSICVNHLSANIPRIIQISIS
jgi:hypothetical protein